MSESAVPQFVLRKIKPAATYHQYGKTNVYTDGLNPAQIPYKWQKNPTLGEFCFNMIEGADIVGSKSNVAMHAWLPHPCGNFSDTSSFTLRCSLFLRLLSPHQKSDYSQAQQDLHSSLILSIPFPVSCLAR